MEYGLIITDNMGGDFGFYFLPIDLFKTTIKWKPEDTEEYQYTERIFGVLNSVPDKDHFFRQVAAVEELKETMNYAVKGIHIIRMQ